MGICLLSKNKQKESSRLTFLTRFPIERVTLLSLALILLVSVVMRIHNVSLDVHLLTTLMVFILIINQIALTWKWHLKDSSLKGLELIFTPSLISLALITGWYLIFVEMMTDYLIVGSILTFILLLHVARMIHWERMVTRILLHAWNWVILSKERVIGLIEIMLGTIVFFVMTQLYSNAEQQVIDGISVGTIALLALLVTVNGILNIFTTYTRIHLYAQEHPMAFRGYVSGMLLFIAIVSSFYQQWIISGAFIVLAIVVGYPLILYLSPTIAEKIKKVARWMFSHVEQTFALVEGVITFSLPFWAASYLGKFLPFIVAILIIDTFIHSINGYNKGYQYMRENLIVFRGIIFVLSIVVLGIGVYFQHVGLILVAMVIGALSGYPFLVLAGKKILEFLERTLFWIKDHWFLLLRSIVTTLGLLVLGAGLLIQDSLFFLVCILIIGVLNIDFI